MNRIAMLQMLEALLSTNGIQKSSLIDRNVHGRSESNVTRFFNQTRKESIGATSQNAIRIRFIALLPNEEEQINDIFKQIPSLLSRKEKKQQLQKNIDKENSERS